MTSLPVRLACELAPCPADRRFLIDEMWGEGAVGIVGGEPKCCKSFLALDIAVAVASGRPCLRRFAVGRPGPVLLFAAEDALHIVRDRLDGIAIAAGTALGALPLHVITAPVVRLDIEHDRDALRDTVASLRPRMLVLDPFVRLHRINENSSDEVAPLLACLRELQREYDVAVLLVHHARKGGHARPGQALRGSSELHAWGDSNLYLHRDRDRLVLTVEHRASASMPPIDLELATDDGIALRVAGSRTESPTAAAPAADRVLGALAAAPTSLTRRALRDACRLRSATVGDALARLLADGLVVQDNIGYRLGTAAPPFPADRFPHSSYTRRETETSNSAPAAPSMSAPGLTPACSCRRTRLGQPRRL